MRQKNVAQSSLINSHRPLVNLVREIIETLRPLKVDREAVDLSDRTPLI